MRYGNHWGVTDTEAALMDALCESGTVPLAAEALRISVASARARLRQVSLRMAGHKPHSRLIVPIRGIPTIRACLMWQQWTATHAERSERPCCHPNPPKPSN